MGSPDDALRCTSKYQCMLDYNDLMRQGYPISSRGLIKHALMIHYHWYGCIPYCHSARRFTFITFNRLKLRPLFLLSRRLSLTIYSIYMCSIMYSIV
jgi:hypothetical protein